MGEKYVTNNFSPFSGPGRFKYYVEIERYFGPPVVVRVMANDAFEAREKARQHDIFRITPGNTTGEIRVYRTR